jgi:hypothetical protein
VWLLVMVLLDLEPFLQSVGVCSIVACVRLWKLVLSGTAVVLVTGRRSHGLAYLRERSEIVLRRMCGWKWKLMVWYVLAQDDDERTLEEEELIAEEEGDKNANEVSDVMCHDSDA